MIDGRAWGDWGGGGEMCLSADGRQNGLANGVGLGVRGGEVTCPGRLGWFSVILLCFCGSSVVSMPLVCARRRGDSAGAFVDHCVVFVC